MDTQEYLKTMRRSTDSSARHCPMIQAYNVSLTKDGVLFIKRKGLYRWEGGVPLSMAPREFGWETTFLNVYATLS